MTKVKSIEETVTEILKDSKKSPHKFSVPYTYQVNTEDLDMICVLLLSLNMSVEVKDIKKEESIIEITHVVAGKVPKLKYSFSLNNEKTAEASLMSLSIDESMKTEVVMTLSNVLTMIKFDE